MFFDFGHYIANAAKDWKEIQSANTTSPKQYGQYLQQKKRGKRKRKKYGKV